MPLSDREYIRGKHPPACTCTECTRRKLQSREKAARFDPRFTSNGKIDHRFVSHRRSRTVQELPPKQRPSPSRKIGPKGYLIILILACIGFGTYFTNGQSSIPSISDITPPVTNDTEVPTTPNTEPDVTNGSNTIPKVGVDEIDSRMGRYKNFYIGLVQDGAMLIGSGCYGEFIVLINNEKSRNPTYSQLLDFLETDRTDAFPYNLSPPVAGFYYGEAEDKIDLANLKNILDGVAGPKNPGICADFAERLHNNAELSGIRCGYVSLNMDDGVGHACNIFETTDRGLIYIDTTGSLVSYGPTNGDMVVSISLGGEYNPDFLFPSGGWYIPEGSMGVVTSITITWNGEWRER